MAKEAAWPSETWPEVRPSSRCSICSIESSLPSRLARMISCGGWAMSVGSGGRCGGSPGQNRHQGIVEAAGSDAEGPGPHPSRPHDAVAEVYVERSILQGADAAGWLE